MHYFRGHPYPINQDGHGLGSILSSIARSAIPLVKSGARFIGRQVLNRACDVGRDVIDGQNVGASVRKRVFGEPQEGSSVKRRRRVKGKRSKKKKSVVRRKGGVKKKTSKKHLKDIFS